MPNEKNGEDLKPIPPEKRNISPWTYWWMMFSMNTCIPMFFLGPIAYENGLSLGQALLAAFLGNLAVVLVLILNSYPGWKYGIPYPVQLRPAFGHRGAEVPVVLRGIVGAGWYGIEAYNGSLAVLMIILAMLGLSADQVQTLSFKYVGIIVIPYVALATLVMMRGLKGIGFVAKYGGPLMFLYFVWLLFYMKGQTGEAVFPAGVALTSSAFLAYLAVQTNWWATVALNISDLSRGVITGKRGLATLILAPLLGIVVAQVAGTALGYLLRVYSGYVTPQEIVLYSAPGLAAVLIGELFAFLAPFSTDVTANIPPIMDILQSTLRLSRKTAAIGSGVIGLILAPWWAVENGQEIVNWVFQFSANYGVLLGPIAGIMLADYYFVRRRGYDVEMLYSGRLPRWAGVGLTSLVASIVIIYIVSWAMGELVKVGPLVFPTQLSWYVGVVSGFVLHLIFARFFKG